MSDLHAEGALGKAFTQVFLGRSIAPYLHMGEELVVARTVRRKGAVTKWLWKWLDSSPAGVELPKKMAVAVTSHRFLIFETRGYADEAKSLLVETGIADVHSVERHNRLTTSPVSWIARGQQYTVSVDKREAAELERALQR